MNIDVFVDLAKNAVNPIKCTWGIGTKGECNIMLGSWMLLRKHLSTQHCHAAKNKFFCGLPRCNCPLQSSQLALVKHIDSAHLSRLSFPCPLHGCEASQLKGLESLMKHYQERHRSMDGRVLGFPMDCMTWKPSPWPWTTNQGVPVTLSSPPPLPQMKIGPGSILVNVDVQYSQATLNLEAMTLQEEGAGASTQGLHPMVRRRRTKLRQLEKPVKTLRNMEEEEDSKVALDDLTKFGSYGSLTGSGDVGDDKKGLRGVGGMADVLKKKVDINIMFAQRTALCLTDLSRPPPMLTSKEGLSMTGGMERTILFEALVKKVDEMERTGRVDTSLI